MDDWRLSLTREEHEHASIEQLKKSLAASRALVEKKNEGLLAAHKQMMELWEGKGDQPAWGVAVADALALKEKS